MILGKDKWK